MVKKHSKFKKNLGPSERQLKVSETVRRIISEGLNIDKIYASLISDVSITVTEVRVSPDLKNATAYVTPFAINDSSDVIACLNDNIYILKSYLANNTHLKFLPNVVFKHDHTFDEVKRLNEIMEKIDK